MKVCKRCKEEKSDIAFGMVYVGTSPELRHICFACVAKKRTKDQIRHATLAEYGMDQFGYEMMLQGQDGVCRGCLKPPDSGKYLEVDHVHLDDGTSGPVRGLLCGQCNQALERAKDDINILRRLVNFLEEFNAKESRTVQVP